MVPLWLQEDLEDDFPHEWEPLPRDVKIDEAKEVLMRELFGPDPRAVFYERQILILFEDQFFHWITAKALHELIEERLIQSEKLPLAENTEIRFYIAKGHRNWRRQAAAIRDIVLQFSTPAFGRALGHHGETMIDAALPRFGFLPVAKNVREYQGKKFPLSEHDLDRVFVRNGVAYGTEIKNRLDYIEKEELKIKLVMCQFFGIRPLFIMRMAPKSYLYEIFKASGYGMTLKWQLYPYGHLQFAKEVHQTLRLPVDSPAAIADATIQRFLDWHRKSLGLSADE